MSRATSRKELSLKGLELFQICAREGSLQAAVRETGLSVSTVSHHLRNLEDHLGVALLDHSRRPMMLTPKGQAFLRNIDDALHIIRMAKAEATSGTITETSHLRIGTIEDFDSDILPELAVFLANQMPRCEFLYQTDTSHAIIDMLRNRHLDLGVTTSPTERMRDLQETPLLREPFVVVLPALHDDSVQDIVAGRSTLPFLRYPGTQMIARQIEQQLRRTGLSLPHRVACGNNQTLMGMVAAGAGWTITTPLLFSRAQRFQSKLKMRAFPGKRFARQLVIVTTPDCSRSVLRMVDTHLRALMTRHTIDPLIKQAPWLSGEFSLLS